MSLGMDSAEDALAMNSVALVLPKRRLLLLLVEVYRTLQLREVLNACHARVPRLTAVSIQRKEWFSEKTIDYVS
jgi:hypothetical protein